MPVPIGRNWKSLLILLRGNVCNKNYKANILLKNLIRYDTNMILIIYYLMIG